MTRIIGGELGSLKLKGPAAATRPTSDRVKESLFSILESLDAIAEASVIDLFAGTGALGLEAASRGARKVTLVEFSPSAANVCGWNIALVQKGLAQTGRRAELELLRKSVFGKWPKEINFDLVIADPPYSFSERELARTLEICSSFQPKFVALEISSDASLPAHSRGLVLLKDRRYGDTKIFIYKGVGSP